jgi:hypothetical protein
MVDAANKLQDQLFNMNGGFSYNDWICGITLWADLIEDENADEDLSHVVEDEQVR